MTSHDREGELRRLAEAATPGPWVGEQHDDGGVCEVYSTNIDDGGFVAHTGAEPICQGRALADAKFIAALDPPTILSLLDQLRDLRKREDEMRADGERKRDLLHGVLWMLDEGHLHRCTDRDHESDYWRRSIRFAQWIIELCNAAERDEPAYEVTRTALDALRAGKVRER